MDAPAPQPPPTFWQGVLKDVHVNASGLIMFGCGACAIFIPSHKEQFEDLAALAATYLFSAAKNKSNGNAS